MSAVVYASCKPIVLTSAIHWLISVLILLPRASGVLGTTGFSHTGRLAIQKNREPTAAREAMSVKPAR
jgi:hypothetical protein